MINSPQIPEALFVRDVKFHSHRVELHFLHDLTGEGPGKRVCDECRQYYITKTEKVVQSTMGKLLIEQ